MNCLGIVKNTASSLVSFATLLTGCCTIAPDSTTAMENRIAMRVGALARERDRIQATHHYRNSLVGLAIMRKDKEAVSYILCQNPGAANETDQSKTTPLYNAVLTNDRTIVEALLKAGADTELSRLNPLVCAANLGNLEIVRMLVEARANVNAHDPNDDPCGITPLCSTEDVEVARFLIEHGADVNLHSPRGISALSRAVYHDNFQMVQLLVEHGASVTSKDKFGKNPLDYAKEKGNKEILRALYQAADRTNMKPKSLVK